MPAGRLGQRSLYRPPRSAGRFRGAVKPGRRSRVGLAVGSSLPPGRAGRPRARALLPPRPPLRAGGVLHPGRAAPSPSSRRKDRRMATYLVTGGCGFIGSHLADALLARGDAVRVLDDLSTGKLANLRARAPRWCAATSPTPLRCGQAMQGVDGCFHLAAIASVERGVHGLARHAPRQPVRHHRRASTRRRAAAAAGGLRLLRRRLRRRRPAAAAEDDADPRPLSAYGADKLGCELHARVAGQRPRPAELRPALLQRVRPAPGPEVALFAA